MKEKIELTIAEVNGIYALLSKLPYECKVTIENIASFLNNKFTEEVNDGNNNLDSILTTQDSCESKL